MNTVTIMGRYYPHESKSEKVHKFSVGVRERVKKDEEWTSETRYYPCVAFGKTKDMLASYFEKGDGIALQGSLSKSEWEKDGQKQSKVEVRVDRVHFIPKPFDEDGAKPSRQNSVFLPPEDDNIPF